jgi:hypothetical protein
VRANLSEAVKKLKFSEEFVSRLPSAEEESCEKIQCAVGNGRRTVPCRDYETIANECVVRNEERCGERSLQHNPTISSRSRGSEGESHNVAESRQSASGGLVRSLASSERDRVQCPSAPPLTPSPLSRARRAGERGTDSFNFFTPSEAILPT